jgi:hypothetical protein
MGLRPTHRHENLGGVNACTIDLAWTARVVCTLDEVRPSMSLIWNARCEPICVAPPILAGRVVAREGV